MKKLLIALPLLALLLTWGHHGAQQAEAQAEACCFPDGTCADVDPATCSTQGGTPGGPGSVCLGVAACAFPDGSCADMDAFCCLNQGGSPGGPGSVCLGVEACCYPDDSCGDHDAYSCLVAGGTPEGPGSNCATTVCGAPPVDLSIEGVGLGCDTAGGSTTCIVPVNTQFTVTMNVDVLPPSTGDYNAFQGYLTHSGGLTWVDRPGNAEIVWPDCGIAAENFGAGWYLGGCVVFMTPPSTHIGAVMEVDYDCGPSASTETVTMVHGYSSNTYLQDSNGQPAAEAGSESLTIECTGPPPTEIKWLQSPDESPWGLDVGTLEPLVPLVLADDFLCTQSGLITEIDFWASWHWDEPPFDDPNLVEFFLSLHSDVPAGEDLPWSHPGELLWEDRFGMGECFVELWGVGEEGWLDPHIGFYDSFADTEIWFYQCSIPEPYWFQQEEGTIYWLDIQAVPIEPTFFWGWKTSIDHWNDASVWTTEPEPVPPLSWFDLWYPPGHPLYGNPIDLAFQLWGQACNPLLDSDADTFYDDVECYLPTDFRDDCTDGAPHDAWPLDMDMNTVVNLTGDAIKYVGKIGCVVATNPECKRLDLDMNGVINLTGDAIMYVGHIGDTCP